MLAAVRRWLLTHTLVRSPLAFGVAVIVLLMLTTTGAIWSLSHQEVAPAALVVLAVAAGLQFLLLWHIHLSARRLEEQDRAIAQRSAELASARTELRAVRAELHEAQRGAIGEMAAAVAHGVRNPLANIRASAQVALLDCKERGTSGLAPKSMVTIVGEVDRLDHRLKELLQFARPATRQCQTIDLNALLRAASDNVQHRVHDADVKIDDRLAPMLPPMMGDPILLEHVFIILMDNAFDAIPKGGGQITLLSGSEDSGKGVRVFAEIRDNGEGISPERIGRIFDLFYSTKDGGTGLGLSIAKKIVDGHGGVITVESEPGQGAVFRVTLPIRGRG